MALTKKVVCNLHMLMALNKIRNVSELQRKTGLNRVTLSRMYNHEAKAMDLGTAVKLCEFFKCEIDELYKLVDKEEYDRIQNIEAERRANNRKGCVYFMKDTFIQLTKVGRTGNLKKRKSYLEKEFQSNLKVLLTIDSDDTVVLEKEIHELLSDKRVEGEWFNLSESDVDFIKEKYKTQA